MEAISAEKIGRFSKAVSAALQNNNNRAFARAYVQALISEVRVSDSEIKIEGPKAALMQKAATFAASGELVPSFAQEWWARRDSNPQPSGYEPPALTVELQALKAAGRSHIALREPLS